MSPERAALEIQGELEAMLEDFGGAAGPERVRAVEAPEDLGPDRCFRVRVSRAGNRDRVVELPVPLAMGYLADEEAAVDEFKQWTAELRNQLAG